MNKNEKIDAAHMHLLPPPETLEKALSVLDDEILVQFSHLRFNHALGKSPSDKMACRIADIAWSIYCGRHPPSATTEYSPPEPDGYGWENK